MGYDVHRGSDWKQWRRMQAWQLSKHGWKSRDIAIALDVSKGTVSQWLTTARLGGKVALQSRPRGGASSKLTMAQMRLIPDFLSHGSEAYGFRGELWTTARVGQAGPAHTKQP